MISQCELGLLHSTNTQVLFRVLSDITICKRGTHWNLPMTSKFGLNHFRLVFKTARQSVLLKVDETQQIFGIYIATLGPNNIPL